MLSIPDVHHCLQTRAKSIELKFQLQGFQIFAQQVQMLPTFQEKIEIE